MAYQAVLFDLDGTLIDSLQDIADATNRTLQKYGFPAHPAESYKQFVGDGVRKLLIRSLPEPQKQDELLIDQCIETYAQDYGANWNVHTRLYPGISEMLDGLVGRGIRLNVLSNKPDLFTQACAKAFLSSWKFDVIMGAKTEFPHKPDPTAARDIARQLGLRTDQFLYMGDSSTDMQTARNAGMMPVGCLWGFRTHDELLMAGASRLISKPIELLDLL
jgi:phosphoglycolate phosphatase